MKILHSTALAALLAGAFITPAVRAADNEPNWHKTYNLTGHPYVSVDVSDSSVDVRSCGSCRTVQVDVQWNDRKADGFVLEESQTGDGIRFKLKEKPGIHYNFGHHREPHVSVQAPANLNLTVHSSDGSISASGLSGDLNFHSSDGSIDLANVGGDLHLSSSDGSLKLQGGSGKLDARTSDGHASLSGKFSAFQVRASDGSISLQLDEGAQLTEASSLQASDGRVSLRIPRSLRAELDVSTSDGAVHNSLPLTVHSYEKKSSGRQHLHGRLNDGTVSLTVHTSDGSVDLSSL